jgi:exodeoxyribonuclease III
MSGIMDQRHDDPLKKTIISWNVNGLRQRHQMNQFLPVFRHNPDIVCIQETKTTGDRIPKDLKKIPGYTCFFNEEHPENLTEVILFSRQEPERVTFGFGNTPFDDEGRILIAEYETFTLMNMYFPLGIGPADTLGHKLAFYDAFLANVSQRNNEHQNVIVCGDFSIAHTDSDISKPVKKNTQRAGITLQERERLDRLINEGFSDTFRIFKTTNGHYSWWPNGFSLEERRLGWRLDYFFVNARVRPYVTSTEILADYEGSDHCPVLMAMEVPEKGSGEKPCVPEHVRKAGAGVPS